VIENVDTLLTSNKGADIAAIRKAIDGVGYDHKTFLIDAAHFVPQSRKRVFIVAAPKGQTIPDLPPMPRRNTTLEGLIDFEAPCDPAPKTERLVELMAPLHKARLETAKASGRRTVLLGCRRTRRPQRFEVRDDGLAGALRTAGGGSSTQSGRSERVDLTLPVLKTHNSCRLYLRSGNQQCGAGSRHRLIRFFAARHGRPAALLDEGVAGVPIDLCQTVQIRRSVR
jgi:site-specific DNA-cytosine methylase